MNPGLRQFISWIFLAIEWVGLVVLACVGFAMDDNAGQDNGFFSPLVQYVQAHAAWIGVGLGTSVLVARLARWSVSDGQTRECRIMHKIVNQELNKFREVVFPGISESIPQDENRVTIFRFEKFKWTFRWWPWSGWLVMLERSGHLTKNRTPIFRAADKPEKCEGVAGQAWRSGAIRSGNPKGLLPDLSDVPYTGWTKAVVLRTGKFFRSSSAAVEQYSQHRKAVETYAAATYTTPQVVWTRLRKRKPCPTSILGILIYTKQKRPWGVLAMDSCNSIACIDSNDKRFLRALKPLMATLAQLEWLSDE